MAKVENIIKGLTGRQMVGQRSPDGFIYDFHLQLWLDRGYIYSSNWRDNDGPFLHKINGKTVPIVELPKDGIYVHHSGAGTPLPAQRARNDRHLDGRI